MSDDPTIGVCWDADRMDLGRVGIQSRQEFMSTAAGREMASGCLNTPNRFLTIDTLGRLRAGLVIGKSELVTDSPFLAAAVAHKIRQNFLPVPEQQRIEMVSEFVRREQFPWLPSRVSVLFACQTMEQLERTATYTRRAGGMSGCVYEIFASNHAGPFDSQIIYMKTSADLAILSKMYWSGMRTNTPMLEWLLPFPLTIGRKVGSISSDGSAVID